MLSDISEVTPLNNAETIASAVPIIVTAPIASSKSCVGMAARLSATCAGFICVGSGISVVFERPKISNTENSSARTNRPLATFTNVVIPFTAMKNGLFS